MKRLSRGAWQAAFEIERIRELLWFAGREINIIPIDPTCVLRSAMVFQHLTERQGISIG